MLDILYNANILILYLCCPYTDTITDTVMTLYGAVLSCSN